MATKVQNGATVDYTAGADITAGDVIVQANLVGVALSDIANGDLGALAVEGVFDFPKTGGVEAFAAGALVYWDVADDVATSDADSGTNKLIGKAVVAATQAATSVRVKLDQ